MKWRDEAPEVADTRATEVKGHPHCGACGGRLQHLDQWRCPYVRCRKWLRGTTDEPAVLDQPKGEAA